MAEAVRWFVDAGNNHDPDAQVTLGYMYACGAVLPTDYQEAARWWRRASERQRWYYNDYGTRPLPGSDSAELWTWLCDSAAHGSDVAHRLLQELATIAQRQQSSHQRMGQIPVFAVDDPPPIFDLLEGEGGTLLRSRAEQGDLTAAFMLGGLHILSLSYHHSASDSNADELNSEAAEWLQRAAQSIPLACRLLSNIYQRTGPPDRWLQAAAEQGDAEAQYWLATTLELAGEEKWLDSTLGEVAADPQARRLPPHAYLEAGMWYRKAAEQGHAPAQYHLAEICSRGRLLSADAVQAVDAMKWYKRAAERGYREAQRELGDRYRSGADAGLPASDEEAAKWFHAAARQGDQIAQRTLALAYFRGRGVPQNGAEAAKWLRLSRID